jgi:hypothetical protein
MKTVELIPGKIYDDADPLCEQTVQFDHDAIDRGPGNVAPEPAGLKGLADLLGAIFDQVLEARHNVNYNRSVGNRLIALAWVVNPNRFRDANEQPMTLADIARMLRIAPQSLQQIAVQWTRKFGISNRIQNTFNRNRRAATGPPKEKRPTPARVGQDCKDEFEPPPERVDGASLGTEGGPSNA